VRSSWGDATCTGPFVASSPGVARLLLACALGARDGSSVEVTVPGPAETLTRDLLREFGFRGHKITSGWNSAKGTAVACQASWSNTAPRRTRLPRARLPISLRKSFPRNQPDRLASKPEAANEGLRYQAPTIMIR
jgi:hypothetical protein